MIQSASIYTKLWSFMTWMIWGTPLIFGGNLSSTDLIVTPLRRPGLAGVRPAVVGPRTSGFQSMGVPPSYHPFLLRIFHEINRPAIGYPQWHPPKNHSLREELAATRPLQDENSWNLRSFGHDSSYPNDHSSDITMWITIIRPDHLIPNFQW